MSSLNTSPKIGTGILIFRDGKILMGKRLGKLGYGTFGWVGGHVEPGEKPIDTAIREIFEETGLIVVQDQLTFLCQNPVTVDGKEYIDIEYTAYNVLGDPIVKEPNKVESWNWYALHQIPQPLFRPCERVLKDHFPLQ